jgi:predicted acylesterase/phospholipase RssA
MTKSHRVLDFGLALGGGGAKGMSHIPFLAALDEMKVRPAMI